MKETGRTAMEGDLLRYTLTIRQHADTVVVRAGWVAAGESQCAIESYQPHLVAAPGEGDAHAACSMFFLIRCLLEYKIYLATECMPELAQLRLLGPQDWATPADHADIADALADIDARADVDYLIQRR